MLSSIGVPGLNGFVGEFLVLIGSFLTARWWAVVAATGVILAALYLLWAYQRVFHGEPDEANTSLRRAEAARGRWCCCRSSALIVFIGVYPKPLLDRIEPSVDSADRHVERARPTYVEPAADGRASRRREGDGRARPAPTLDRPRRRLVRAQSPLLVLLGGGAGPARRRRADAAVAARRLRARSPPSPALGADRARRSSCGTTSPTTARRTLVGGALALRRLLACSSPITICAARGPGRARHRRLPAPRGARRARGLRPVCCWPPSAAS